MSGMNPEKTKTLQYFMTIFSVVFQRLFIFAVEVINKSGSNDYIPS